MGNKSQLDEIDEQIQLAFSNAKEKENLEKERALYAKQVERIHELNANLEGLAKKFSLLEVKADKLKASVDSLFTVGLSEEGKKMVRDQLNDIFKEKIAQMKKEADKEIKRVINEDSRVSAPLSVVTIISVALSILLFFFGGLIVANGDLVQSEWLNDYIVRMAWLLGGSVASLVLGFYLYHRYLS